MTIECITLANGNATYAEGRTVATETGLPPDSLVELVETVSRQTGTGYRNSIYHVKGTYDAIIIRHNDGPADNIHWDNVQLVKGYYSERKDYAKRIGNLSNKYRIPFEVCLAIGDREEAYPLFLSACANVDRVSIRTYRDLTAGIARRKKGIQDVLGNYLYDLINIEKMGQRNSQRVADYIAALYEKEQKKEKEKDIR
jgi:hypothetical protein